MIYQVCAFGSNEVIPSENRMTDYKHGRAMKKKPERGKHLQKK